MMALASIVQLGIMACERSPSNQTNLDVDAVSTPTNRVEIPPAVRRHLGVEFARVESRPVESTLRVPGRFELLPDARRDHRAPLPGSVEILVAELDRVEPGTPLFRLSGSEWVDLEDRINRRIDRRNSILALREAKRGLEVALTERVALWQERLNRLERLRVAGDGDETAVSEAGIILNEARTELAATIEERVELEADESLLQIELASLRMRRDLLRGGGDCPNDDRSGLLVCSTVDGVVEAISATSGSIVDRGESILSVIQPDRVRVRARMLQSDLPRLNQGGFARISAPSAGSDQTLSSMPARVALTPIGDPESRTIDLLATPERLANWARPGVGVSLEVILDGGGLELAVPQRAIVEDDGIPVLFRRDPRDPDRAIRIDADLGRSDGRWIEILSGVGEGDQVVVAGQDQLLLAMDDQPAITGHFHADGTFHAEDH